MPVYDAPLSADALAKAASRLEGVSADFADLIGRPPTLGELLEVLGWAIPANNDAADATFAPPMTFKANLKGNRRYASAEESRVGELNDSIFSDATDHLIALIEDLDAATGAPVSPQLFASAILQVLRTGQITLADVSGGDVRKLAVNGPTRNPKPKVGDVVAIPAQRGGYHLAVVVARNRFGTALGLFYGTSPLPRLGPAARRAPRPHPVHTNDRLIVTGVWRVVDHDETLLSLFPAEPEIYHKPGQWSDIGIDTGEFGAAETADGTIRLIGPDEAREVGLLDGTYRQVETADFLQRRLDEEDKNPD
jgi:hypothetical protein